MTAACDSAAAYVLGALPAAERARLRGPPLGLPGLPPDRCRPRRHPRPASRVSPDGPRRPRTRPRHTRASAAAPVRRSGRRRRVVMGALGPRPWSCLAVAGTARLVEQRHDEPSTVAMTPVVQSPVSATAALVARPWGTQVTMDCHYQDGSEWSRPYSARGGNVHGEEREIATWVVGPSHEATISGSVPWPPAAIHRVEVRTVSGTALLRLTP